MTQIVEDMITQLSIAASIFSKFSKLSHQNMQKANMTEFSKAKVILATVFS